MKIYRKPHPNFLNFCSGRAKCILLEAAARHRCGTAGGSKIWNVGNRVYVTPA